MSYNIENKIPSNVVIKGFIKNTEGEYDMMVITVNENGDGATISVDGEYLEPIPKMNTVGAFTGMFRDLYYPDEERIERGKPNFVPDRVKELVILEGKTEETAEELELANEIISEIIADEDAEGGVEPVAEAPVAEPVVKKKRAPKKRKKITRKVK